jgi:cell pole-organizing protein PopZ|tara:strand:- start:4469 stop:5089 length:621 start_codon:yes stop_codon:yes gene_type:complete
MKVYTMKNNGIVYTEEVPTNSASSGAIAGLPPDEPPVRKKKKNLRTSIFQRIKNARIKEETMEDQTVIQEMNPDNSNTEVSSAMRMIQQKRKLQKKQEREKRAANRKQEIAALSKAKAKDYQKKASDRQKTISKDINKMSNKKTEKNSYDWQGAFSSLNEDFSTLSIEEQTKALKVWLELSEENSDKFLELVYEDIDKLKLFLGSV